MQTIFDPLNILLLAAAAVVIWKLKSVLGQRSGFERPPVEVADARQAMPSPPALSGPGSEDPPVDQAWKGYAEPGSQLALTLSTIAANSKAFTAQSFIDGAKIAYEMIHEAFAKGDRPALQPLLTKEVLNSFTSSIAEREKAGHSVNMQFVGIKSAKIENAQLDGKLAQIAVRFVAEMISATKDSAGTVIEGDDHEVHEIRDLWTFERDVSARDPNWKLADTSDDAP